jgi:Spy/CpxP family protein refolding chaperone
MLNRRTLLMTLALVAMLASFATAQPGPRGRQHQDRNERGAGPELRIERLAERLDLTDQQQEAIAAIQEDARKAGRDLHKELARLQNQRRGEMLEDDPSEKTLVDLTEQMGAIKTKLQVHRLQTRLAVQAQLTEEQRDQMMLMNHRRGGRGERFACDGSGPCNADGDDQGRRGRGRRR